jgi:anti-sigma factor RsiW
VVFRYVTKRRIRGLLFGLPTMINCHEFEKFILEYLDEELPTVQLRVFEVHLRMCPDCRVYLAAYEATRVLGEAAFGIGPDAPVPDEVPEDLITAILDARSASPQG